ncbi:MAG: hypothetical protein WD071_06850 [Pseudohongiella sp.]|uniref:hypothetical protein n=1 Tax=Pseudohongiella sp. TaxID=1979412 RepID=UPI0034A039DA
MMPLEIMQWGVDRFTGTPYEAWVNALLFGVFVAAVVAALRVLIGKSILGALARIAYSCYANAKESLEYPREAKAWRERIWPYFNIVISIYLGLIGVLSASIVSIAYFFGSKNDLPIKIHFLALLWILGSFVYVRLNMVQFSWSLHAIRSRR